MSERHPSIPADYTETFRTGFNNYIGPIWVGTRDEGLHFMMAVEERHLNAGGVLHGGVIMTFADVALGMTVFNGVGKRPCATISMNTDFLAAAKMGEVLEGVATINRKTTDVVFVQGRVYTATRDIATATGLWKLLHTNPKQKDPT